jgi:hypothetical protein
MRAVAKGKVCATFAHTDMVLFGFFYFYLMRLTARAFVTAVAKNAVLGFAATAH